MQCSALYLLYGIYSIYTLYAWDAVTPLTNSSWYGTELSCSYSTYVELGTLFYMHMYVE